MLKLMIITILVISNLAFSQEEIEAITPEKLEEVSSQPKKKSPAKSETKKDGKNVYHFNFYHGQDDKKEKKTSDKKAKPAPKAAAVDKVKPIPIRKRMPLRKGNGAELGLFTMSYLNGVGDASEFDLGIGLRVGYQMMNKTSGSYFTPGVMLADAGADHDGLGKDFMAREYDGSVAGVYLKYGRMMEKFKDFALNIGVEGSYFSGKLSTDGFFGDGTYEIDALNFSAFGGPVFQIREFQVSALLNVGMGRLAARESVNTSDYSDSGQSIFYGLNVNGTFVF